jgi:hypothetical protein
MKETLEEAAEKYVKADLKKTPLYWLFHDSFKAGAKWMQERMYSEEDIISLIQFLSMNEEFNGYNSVSKDTAKYYLEQFKK